MAMVLTQSRYGKLRKTRVKRDETMISEAKLGFEVALDFTSSRPRRWMRTVAVASARWLSTAVDHQP